MILKRLKHYSQDSKNGQNQNNHWLWRTTSSKRLKWCFNSDWNSTFVLSVCHSRFRSVLTKTVFLSGTKDGRRETGRVSMSTTHHESFVRRLTPREGEWKHYPHGFRQMGVETREGLLVLSINPVTRSFRLQLIHLKYRRTYSQTPRPLKITFCKHNVAFVSLRTNLRQTKQTVRQGMVVISDKRTLRVRITPKKTRTIGD